MDRSSDQKSVAIERAERPTFLAGQAAAWLAICLVVAIAAAYGAALQERIRAPLLVFPILVGLVIGLALAAGLRLLPMAHRTTAWLGAIGAVALAVFLQHYIDYRHAVDLGRKNEARLRLLTVEQPDFDPSMFVRTPKSLLEYLQGTARRGRVLFGNERARGAMVWISWGVDALLTLAAALVVVVPALYRPYCNRCRSWFRAIRSGRLPRAAGAAVAELAGLRVQSASEAADYRLAHCRSGCGPARFELLWDLGTNQSAWIDAEARQKIVAVLDGAMTDAPS